MSSGLRPARLRWTRNSKGSELLHSLASPVKLSSGGIAYSDGAAIVTDVRNAKAGNRKHLGLGRFARRKTPPGEMNGSRLGGGPLPSARVCTSAEKQVAGRAASYIATTGLHRVEATPKNPSRKQEWRRKRESWGDMFSRRSPPILQLHGRQSAGAVWSSRVTLDVTRSIRW